MLGLILTLYKRVTALVNRILRGSHRKAINRKRVYRLMKMHGLILPKSGEKRMNHEGTGQVMTLHSNTRWCSDAFEIKCWNGEKVFVAFSLDCCDREAIHFVSSVEPLTQKNIAELIIAKQRNGPTDTIKLAFLKQFTRFEDVYYG